MSKNKKGYVYVFERKDGLVKIGCSTNPEKRKKTIESYSGTPTHFYLTDLCSNYRIVETQTHKSLIEYNEYGEWFNCGFDIAVDKVNDMFELYAEFNPTIEDNDTAGLFEEMLVKMCPIFEEIKSYDDIRERIDLDKWNPKESEEKEILDFMYKSYEAMIECCGDEEAQPYLELYNKIKQNGIAQCKSEIQDVFLDLYWAVDGDIETYYTDSNDNMLSLIKRTVLSD